LVKQIAGFVLLNSNPDNKINLVKSLKILSKIIIFKA
jgi:hypothetical protein